MIRRAAPIGPMPGILLRRLLRSSARCHALSFASTSAIFTSSWAYSSAWLANNSCANSGTVSTNSDTITLNRSTTGSVTLGEWLEVEDIAANTWAVNGMLSATGAAFATPFTAAV